MICVTRARVTWPTAANSARLVTASSRMADHLTAEYRVKTQGRGRTVDEWKLRPERADNHWFDCLVGSAVAASIQGTVLLGTDAVPAPKRGRVSFAALQRSKRR